MATRDPRVDTYIAKSADFARPILVHLRKLVHAACPGVSETIKWGVPHFDYKGMMCSMASFSGHCTFGFWKGALVLDGRAERTAMGHFGRITSLDDLPADRMLIAYVKKAAALNDNGVKVARARPAKKPARTPADLAAGLRTDAAARRTFAALSPSHKREYIEWITEAKTNATREKRVATTIAWLAEGKARNWKYQ